MLANLARGFSFIVLVRIGSRIIDFFLHILVIRAINPKVFASTVHFQLITNVALFYSKNCLKTSYQKRPQRLTPSETCISAANIMLFGVPITFFLGLLIVCLQMWLNGDSETLQYFSLAAAMYALSAVFQSLQQTLISKLVLEFDYKRIGTIQIFSLLSKSVVLWISVYFNLFETHGVLVFGASQLVYGVVLFALSLLQFPPGILLQKISSGEYVAEETKQSVREFTVISVIKLLLQQVQKIILVIDNDVSLLSIYTLVRNLGSVIPRFIFQPLQEIAYNVFARSQSEAECKLTLETLLKLQFVFGTILSLFGYLYSQNLILLLFGEAWANPATINALASYCFYIFTMGLNGISETFVYARIKAEQLPQFRVYMMITTAIYLSVGTASIYYGQGAAGLFLASSMGMIFRVYACWKLYIGNFYGFNFGRLLSQIIVGRGTLAFYVVTFLSLSQVNNRFQPFANLLIAGICAGINLGVTVLAQRESISRIRTMTRVEESKKQ